MNKPFSFFVFLFCLLVFVSSVNAYTSVTTCRTLSSAGEYRLANSIIFSGTGTCFTVTQDGVILNGNGKSIVNTGTLEGTAIDLQGYDNIKIYNLTIHNVHRAIYSIDADGLTDGFNFSDNYISTTAHRGIEIPGGDGIIIQNNYINVTGQSILIGGQLNTPCAINMLIEGNTLDSNSNTIEFGQRCDGNNITILSNDIYMNDIVDGHPGVYIDPVAGEGWVYEDVHIIDNIFWNSGITCNDCFEPVFYGNSIIATNPAYGIILGGTTENASITFDYTEPLPGYPDGSDIVLDAGSLSLLDESDYKTSSTFVILGRINSGYFSMNFAIDDNADISAERVKITKETMYIDSGIATIDASEFSTSFLYRPWIISFDNMSNTVSMDDPTIVLNGNECNATTVPACTDEYYDSGMETYSFNTTALTTSTTGIFEWTITDKGDEVIGTDALQILAYGDPNGDSKLITNGGVYCPDEEDTFYVTVINTISGLSPTDGMIYVTTTGNITILSDSSIDCSSVDCGDINNPISFDFDMPNETSMNGSLIIIYNESTIYDDPDIFRLNVSIENGCHAMVFVVNDATTGAIIGEVSVTEQSGAGTGITDWFIGQVTIGGLEYQSYSWKFEKFGYLDSIVYTSVSDLDIGTGILVLMTSEDSQTYNQPFTPPTSVSNVTQGFLNITYAFVAAPFNWIMLAIIILLGLGLIKLLIGAVTGQ